MIHTDKMIYFQCVYLLIVSIFAMCNDSTALERYISNSFPMGDNYTGIQSAELHLCIINHLTGRPVRIQRAKQQAHSNISRFITHTHIHTHNQDTFLTACVIDANHQSLWINQRAWECREAVYVWVSVHMCMHALAAKLWLAVCDEKLQMLPAF